MTHTINSRGGENGAATASKYTPGPWYVYVGENREAIAVQKFVPGANGGTVAKGVCKMPVPQSWGAKSQHNTQEEIDANARLIAAAPDLLACLTALHGYVQSGINEGGVDEWCDKARAAISKATGGEA